MILDWRETLRGQARAAMMVALGQSLADLAATLQRAGFPQYRAKQVFQWLYGQGAREWREMRNLPREMLDWLDANARVGGCERRETLEGTDGSMKVLWGLADGRCVEGVLMPEKERRTLCVSSQVGCPLACRFCVTGTGGLARQLAADEILGQVIEARRLLAGRGEALTNIVFMGMGEPLLNLGPLIASLRLIVSPQAIAFSPRRVTVSTAGVIAGIAALREAALGVRLAVSLNAVEQSAREALMPIARANPLPELLAACRAFQQAGPAWRPLTFEYVLLAGVNDSPAEARALARLVGGLNCKVNLIPFNPDARLPFERPAEEAVEAFRDILLAARLTVAVRHSKGGDIRAACGQLALRNPADGGAPQ